MNYTGKIILGLILLSLTTQAEARSESRSFVDRALSNVTVPSLHAPGLPNIHWSNPDSNKARKANIPVRKPGPLSAQDPEYMNWYAAHRATQVANTGGSMMATGTLIVFGTLIYQSSAAKPSIAFTELFVLVGASLAIAGLSLMISGSERARKYRKRSKKAGVL